MNKIATVTNVWGILHHWLLWLSGGVYRFQIWYLQTKGIFDGNSDWDSGRIIIGLGLAVTKQNDYFFQRIQERKDKKETDEKQ